MQSAVYGTSAYGSSLYAFIDQKQYCAEFGIAKYGATKYAFKCAIDDCSKYGISYFGANNYGLPCPPPVLTGEFFLGYGVSGKLGKEGDADPLNVNGIYQMRMTKRGKVPVKMKFYRPTNPRTPAQQANRQKFTDAMAAWQSLTQPQKDVYNTRAKKRSMFGWGLYIREYYQKN